MPRRESIRRRRWHALSGTLLVGAAGLWAPPVARAHFILVAPDSWMSQDGLGLPEKLGPCGNEGGGTATGTVTAYHPGDTISVTINEVIPHPGHYRVALAVNDRSEIPAEPEVTPTAGDPCGSVAVQSPARFPILADNLLPHTHAFTAPQTFTITLPTDVTCTKCTLQVLEFMSQHSAPCFYHHCADISIQSPPEPPTPTPLAPTATRTETPAATPSPTPLAVCVGACNADGAVTMSALITLVDIALGNAPPSACPSGIPSASAVDVTLLLQAVNNAFTPCGE